MRMIHRDDQKLQIQQATDIVRLIGEQIALRPKGREYLGLCPFHDDKNPSMHVSPAKQIYKCFSCGAGGDVFTFMMNYHKMTFPEALGHLAEQAGIALAPVSKPAGRGGESSGASQRQMIAQATQQAVGFFRSVLKHAQHGQTARGYLEKRGVSLEIQEAFEIGHAPELWDGLVQMIDSRGWDAKAFEWAGLISPRKSGEGCYDRFRSRLMFPICDALGRPIAFGARRLNEEDEPKYLNSPESPLFNKSATLYGLHLAKKAIIDSHTAVIVEGYTDVIACHQAGVANVVATLGTSLTREHEAALSRLCDRVVLVFDADEAGQKAADRAVEVFLKGALDVGVVVLPEGNDPAELLAGDEGGAERFEQMISEAADALAFKFSRMAAQLEGQDTVSGRDRMAKEYIRQLIDLGLLGQGAIRKAMVIDRLAALLGISARAVEQEVSKAGRRPAYRGAANVTGSTATPLSPTADYLESGVALSEAAPKIRGLRLAEKNVIGCLLRQPDLFHLILSNQTTLDETLTPADMFTPAAKTLYTRVYETLSDDRPLTLAALLADLAADDELGLAALATDAEAAVEARCGEDLERLEGLLRGSVDTILERHKEQDYQAKRDAVVGPTAAADNDQETLMHQLLEHRRDHPSATRIARMEAGT